MRVMEWAAAMLGARGEAMLHTLRHRHGILDTGSAALLSGDTVEVA
jgi:hypothetical protein